MIRFSEEGAVIVACARRTESPGGLVRGTDSRDGEALGITCDVAEESDIANVASAARRDSAGSTSFSILLIAAWPISRTSSEPL